MNGSDFGKFCAESSDAARTSGDCLKKYPCVLSSSAHKHLFQLPIRARDLAELHRPFGDDADLYTIADMKEAQKPNARPRSLERRTP